MKKILCLTVTLVLFAGFGNFAMAADGTWTGWIADENCAKSYEKAANPGHVGCAKGCVKKGAKWALATQNGHHILDIDAAQAEQHLGHQVTIKGDLNSDTNTIKVSSVQ